MKGCLTVFVVLFLAIIIIGQVTACRNDDKPNDRIEQQQTQKSNEIIEEEDRISPYAVLPITKQGYPKLYAKWGDDGVRRINSLMPLAAEKAATSPDCDKVIIVDISTQRSIPGKKIVFFVDCENGERFYVSDSDLQEENLVQSQKKKMSALSDGDAITYCVDAVKAKLKYPHSFKRKFGSTSVYRGGRTGNVVVSFDFSSTNSFGAEIVRHARCVIDDSWFVEVTISD